MGMVPDEPLFVSLPTLVRTIPSPIPCRRATHPLHTPALVARLSVNRKTRLLLAWPVHSLRRGACPRSSGRRHTVPPHLPHASQSDRVLLENRRIDTSGAAYCWALSWIIYTRAQRRRVSRIQAGRDRAAPYAATCCCRGSIYDDESCWQRYR
jgi:hypothetical protein